MKLSAICDELNSRLQEITEEQSLFYQLENELSLEELRIIIRTADGEIEANTTNLEPFRVYLADRWERVRGTDLAYPHAPHSALSKIVCYLAECLVPVYGKTQYELMMPTLKIIEHNVLMTSLETQPLQTFVLSDDDSRPIDVIASLCYASEDGALRHTAILEDSPDVRLSEPEGRRVRWHSPDTNDYYLKIDAVVKSIHEGKSIGSFIMRLTDKLLAGDAYHGEGRDLDSGAKANLGILAFAEFVEQLTEEEKATVFQLKASNYRETLGDYWSYLSRSKEDNYKETKYCVYNIAARLKEILAANPALYHQYPSKKAVTIKVETDGLVAAREEQAAIIKRLLQSGDYKVYATYGDMGRKRLAGRILKQMSLPAIIPKLTTIGKLIDLLGCLPSDEWPEVLNGIDHDHWERLVIDPHQLTAAVQALTESQRFELIKTIPDSILIRQISSKTDLGKVVNLLPIEHWMHFLRRLPVQVTNRIILDGAELSAILRVISSDKALYFLQSLGNDRVARALKTAKCLTLVINQLPEHEAHQLLALIGYDQLSAILGKPEKIDEVLESMTMVAKYNLVANLDLAWVKSFFIEAWQIAYILRHLPSVKVNQFLTALGISWLRSIVKRDDDILNLIVATNSASHQWLLESISAETVLQVLKRPILVIDIIGRLGGDVDFFVEFCGHEAFCRIFVDVALFWPSFEARSNKLLNGMILKKLGSPSLKAHLLNSKHLLSLYKCVSLDVYFEILEILGKEFVESLIEENFYEAMEKFSPEALNRFIEFFNAERLIPHSSELNKFWNAFASRQDKSTNELLINRIGNDRLKAILRDSYHLSDLCSGLTKEFYFEVLTRLGSDFVLALVHKNIDALIYKFDAHSTERFIEFVGLDKVIEEISFSYSIDSLFAKRPSLSWETIFKLVNRDYFSSRSSFCFTGALKKLSIEDGTYFLEWFGFERLKALDFHSTHIISVLRYIPKDAWRDWLIRMGSAKIADSLGYPSWFLGALEELRSFQAQIEFVDLLDSLDFLVPVFNKIRSSSYESFAKELRSCKYSDKDEFKKAVCYAAAKYHKAKITSKKSCCCFTSGWPSFFHRNKEQELAAATIIEESARANLTAARLDRALQPYNELLNTRELNEIYWYYPRH